jgi:uncharacterized membrane protein
MPALKRQPAAEGVAAMQRINVLAVTPVFMTALFGTGAACLGLAAWTAVASEGPAKAFVLAGCALYLVGTVGVTIAANVPLNDRLAAVSPDAPARVLSEARDAYEGRWDFWNRVRTAFSALAFLVLIGSCLLREDRAPRGESSPAYEGRFLR